jgi:hypothetical protein
VCQLPATGIDDEVDVRLVVQHFLVVLPGREPYPSHFLGAADRLAELGTGRVIVDGGVSPGLATAASSFLRPLLSRQVVLQRVGVDPGE